MPYHILTYKGLDLRVNYYYQPEEKMIGCGENIEINSISLGDFDLTELLESDMENITNAIYEEWNNNNVQNK